MPNTSYKYSFSNFEYVHRLIELYMRSVQTSLYAEVVEDPMGFESEAGEVSLKVLNTATRVDEDGRTYKLEFPNLLRVPVLNRVQNITLPKVTTGQKGIIVFQKHPVEDVETVFEETLADVLPDPKLIFSLADGLFIPVTSQREPIADTTVIESINMRFLSEKIQVLNIQQQDLISLLQQIIAAIGMVPVITSGGTPISALAPNFPVLIEQIESFVKNPTS